MPNFQGAGMHIWKLEVIKWLSYCRNPLVYLCHIEQFHLVIFVVYVCQMHIANTPGPQLQYLFQNPNLTRGRYLFWVQLLLSPVGKMVWNQFPRMAVKKPSTLHCHHCYNRTQTCRVETKTGRSWERQVLLISTSDADFLQLFRIVLSPLCTLCALLWNAC